MATTSIVNAAFMCVNGEPLASASANDRPVRFLVPVANTPSSVFGFLHALTFAKRAHAVVHVLHCLQQLPDEAGVSLAEKVAKVDQLKYGRRCWDELQDARGLLDRCSKKMKKHDIPYSLELASFLSVRECILTVAHRSKADFIVMGTQDRSNIDRLFQTASMTKSVIEASDIPVITVKHAGEILQSMPILPSPLKITVPFDASPSSIIALISAAEMARISNGFVHLVYISSGGIQETKSMRVILDVGARILADQQVNHTCSQHVISQSESIFSHVCSMGSDSNLVVLGSKLTSSRRPFAQSNAIYTIRRCPVPVMHVRMDEKSEKWTKSCAQLYLPGAV